MKVDLPSVSIGGAENRNAPNDTAALSFVENSEAARYVFVAVVIGDVIILAVVMALLCWRECAGGYNHDTISETHPIRLAWWGVLFEIHYRRR